MIIDTDSQNIPQKNIPQKNVPGIGIVDYESDQENKSVEMEGKIKSNIIENTIENGNGDVSTESADVRAKYSLYKMFWGLQSYMSCENVKRFTDCPAASTSSVSTSSGGGTGTAIASTTTASTSSSTVPTATTLTVPTAALSVAGTVAGTGVTAVDNQKLEWNCFMGHANSVLEAFEKGKKIRKQITQMRSLYFLFFPQ